MKKLYISLISSLLVVSTWAIAEETDLLDAYLEDLPSTSTSQNVIVGQPVDVVVDENGQTHEVIRPQAMEYRRIETADGSEIYQEVPIKSAANTKGNVQIDVPEVVVVPEGEMSADVMVSNESEVRGNGDLEVIELEPEEGEIAIIEAPENQTTQTVAVTNSASNRTAISGHAFCQQNPYTRECLLSKYLSLCKKDPQSTDCKSQLQKFDNFCGTFPNAYKCKKAKIAAACQNDPSSNACKDFTQRFCQKFPKAIFCNYN
ncbi:MAG: hypothetical protein GKR92_04760 [Gammaproteobacteria bacterium]|nr:MAG: hypothetical protein GKR92_04760 [Gammaproteobacteria bacterium]